MLEFASNIVTSSCELCTFMHTYPSFALPRPTIQKQVRNIAIITQFENKAIIPWGSSNPNSKTHPGPQVAQIRFVSSWTLSQKDIKKHKPSTVRYDLPELFNATVLLWPNPIYALQPLTICLLPSNLKSMFFMFTKEAHPQIIVVFPTSFGITHLAMEGSS